MAPPPLTPPHKGEGESERLGANREAAEECLLPNFPSPLWEGVRGGGKNTSAVATPETIGSPAVAASAIFAKTLAAAAATCTAPSSPSSGARP
jgi:hypothetical protein